MNKSVFLLSALLLSTHCFGFSFSKHHNVLPTQTHIQSEQRYEDFSGNWVGSCENQFIHFVIKQSATRIHFIVSDEDGEDDHAFDINKLETHSLNSTVNQSTKVNNASLVGNYLSLTSLEFSKNNEMDFWQSFNERRKLSYRI